MSAHLSTKVVESLEKVKYGNPRRVAKSSQMKTCSLNQVIVVEKQGIRIPEKPL